MNTRQKRSASAWTSEEERMCLRLLPDHANRLACAAVLLTVALLLVACGKAPPSFELQPTDELIPLVRGEQSVVQSGVIRDPGFEGPLEVTASNLPSGVDATTHSVQEDEDTVDITVSAQADAKLGSSEIEVVGSSGATAVTAAATLMVKDSAGVLDETFSDDGWLRFEPATDMDSWATSVAEQDDGKYVVAGSVFVDSDAREYFLLVRLMEDGQFDTTFGEDGYVLTPFQGDTGETRRVEILPDGKILVAGYVRDGTNRDLILLRYSSDGELDPEFGTDGIVVGDFGSSEVAYDMALLPDGSIALAGEQAGATLDFAVWRYHPSGELDTDFGVGGMRVVDFGGSEEAARGIAVLDNDGLAVVGHSDVGGNDDFAVIRLDSSGDLDNAFDADGRVTFDNGGATDGAWDVAVSKDRLVVGGFSRGADNDFMLVRFLSDGSVDSSFGSGGSVVTDFGGVDEIIFAIGLQDDEKIVAAGASGDVGGAQSFLVARYSEDGSLDSTFGSGGKVETAIGTARHSVLDLTLDTPERITAVGLAEGDDGRWDAAVVRYWQ